MRTDAGVVGALPAALLRSASDQLLVEHVRAGSHRAFETLSDRHERGIARHRCLVALRERRERHGRRGG
jgi:hypothetical protein